MKHCLKIALLGRILIPCVRASFRNNVFSDITAWFWFSAVLILIAKALQQDCLLPHTCKIPRFYSSLHASIANLVMLCCFYWSLHFKVYNVVTFFPLDQTFAKLFSPAFLAYAASSIGVPF